MPRAVDGLKTCTACLVVRVVEDFPRNRSTADGLHNQCRGCNSEAKARWRAANPEKNELTKYARKYVLKRYGLTEESYDALLASQGGGCAICGLLPEQDRRKLSVDHDHTCCPEKLQSCGRCVRGLLCSNCNTALGLMRDDPARLSAAIAYLSK